jgi:hypothetical protein
MLTQIFCRRNFFPNPFHAPTPSHFDYELRLTQPFIHLRLKLHRTFKESCLLLVIQESTCLAYADAAPVSAVLTETAIQGKAMRNPYLNLEI